MFTDNWTDEKWTDFIRSNVERVKDRLQLPDEDSTPLADIRAAADPRFRRTIDHTLLKPEATLEHIDKLCEEAVQYGFKSCCVNGIYIKRVSERLNSLSSSPRDPDTQPIPCCVVGFPLGAGSANSKAHEAKEAILSGALEIDTVLPIGLLLSTPPPYSEIYLHLKTITAASYPLPVKVIIETQLLSTLELKVAACVLAAEAGAAFVKTSTGFSGGGATTEDVRLMKVAVEGYKWGEKVRVKVKASGGVRTFEACMDMFRAGAERIGTSSGAAIMGADASDDVVKRDSY